MTYSYYTIETPKGSSVRFAKDPLTGTFCYRRSDHTPYPCYYGYVQDYDAQGKLLTSEKDELDFFLISNHSFDAGMTIKEKDLLKIVKFKCWDKDTNEEDDKLVVILKEQKHAFSNKSLNYYLDAIVAFLLCRRSNFVLKDLVFYPETPTTLKEFYKGSSILWPKDYDLKNPDEKAFKSLESF